LKRGNAYRRWARPNAWADTQLAKKKNGIHLGTNSTEVPRFESRKPRSARKKGEGGGWVGGLKKPPPNHITEQVGGKGTQSQRKTERKVDGLLSAQVRKNERNQVNPKVQEKKREKKHN